MSEQERFLVMAGKDNAKIVRHNSIYRMPRKKKQSEPPKLSPLNQALFDAIKGGKFLVAIWQVGDKNTLTLYRETLNFPVAQFEAAVKQLQANLDDEANKIVKQQQTAKALPPPTA